MLNEIQLEYFGVVDGIGELFFMTVSNLEHILSHQRGDFVNNSSLFSHIRETWYLRLKFLKDFRNPLLGGDARRHQRQAKHVLYEAHLGEHGLHAGRVAIDEQKTAF